jgi:hypothetical protein
VCLQDNYAFAQCKRVLPVSAVRGLGVPLPPAEVEMLEENLTWDEIQVRSCVCHLFVTLLHLSSGAGYATAPSRGRDAGGELDLGRDPGA